MQIYLDYNASSPLAPEVIEALRPYLDAAYGNPSSLHWAGRPAKEAIDQARRQLANLLGARPSEIVFTGGGTESDNYAVQGAFGAWLRRGKAAEPDGGDAGTRASLPLTTGVVGKHQRASADASSYAHFVTSAIEHPAILKPMEALRDLFGAEVTEVGVDSQGRVSPGDVERAIRPETVLVSVMHANNETGVIQPIGEIGAICRERGVLFHTDAAQSVGKVPIDVEALGVDLLTVAGHKLLAPKGIGALYVRDGVVLEPLLHGAGHESGRRSGTENTPWIVALGAAAASAEAHFADGADSEIAARRDRFEAGLGEIWGDDVVIHGKGVPRLPNTCSASFVGRVGQEVLDALDGVAASTGAACHSGVVELSRVLRAMGVSETVGMGTIRFSLGRYTSDAEIDAVLAALRKARG